MAIIIIIIIYNRRIEEQFFPSWTNLYLKFLVPKDPTWTPKLVPSCILNDGSLNKVSSNQKNGLDTPTKLF